MANSLRVFVSHSHTDQSFTRQIVNALRHAGADVWYDEDNLSSGNLLNTIERELFSRPVFIPILSRSSLESNWMKDEASWAYNLTRRDPTRIILPVIAAPISEDNIWLWLQDFKRIEKPGGQPYPPEEAAQLVLRLLGLATSSETADIDTLIARGASLRANGDLAAALDVLASATQHAPRSADAWISYGLALAEADKFGEALAAFDHALEIDPKSELAMRSKADALFSSGQYVEAVQAYDRALEDNPMYVTAWYNRGTALLTLRRFKEAVENYRTLQRLDPRNSDVFMFQADALWQIGQRREAIAAFEQALELKPGSLGDLTRPIRTLIRRHQ